MTSICRQFVEAEVRQQFQPQKINITGIPVNRIIHSTFKTHWQLWHMGKQHNIEKAQTRSDWHIHMACTMAVRPPFSPLQHKTWRNSCMHPTETVTCWQSLCKPVKIQAKGPFAKYDVLLIYHKWGENSGKHSSLLKLIHNPYWSPCCSCVAPHFLADVAGATAKLCNSAASTEVVNSKKRA